LEPPEARHNLSGARVLPSGRSSCDASFSVAARLKFQGSAFGVGFTVQADAAGLLDEARLRMPPTWRPGRSGRPRRHYALVHAPDGVRVEAEGTTLGQALSHRGALDALESDLQLFVAQHSREFVFVHAGVVGVRGKALLLPGTSGAGKTTLVQALLKAGATYYSDEYALLDSRGQVHPYPRALSVRLEDGSGKVRFPVLRSVSRVGKHPLSLGVVLVTEFCSGSRWAPEPMTRGEVVLALLSNTVPARDRPAEVMAALARAASEAEGFRTLRGNARGVALAALRLVGASPRSAKLKSHVHRARLHPTAPSQRPRVPRSRR
jgi:hypothetical protein